MATKRDELGTTSAVKSGFFLRCVSAASAAVLLTAAGPAFAGPPFVTDDPEPTDFGHWEIYNFVAATHVPGDTAGEAGFDINYGGLKDLQLTAVIPVAFESRTQTGLGDVELAIKYRFLHQADGSLIPDVAFFPRAFTPTATHPVGANRLSFLLPIWAEKDFGKWSLFGGGGYDINPGPDNRNFWLTGVGFSRVLTSRFTLGAELYQQTAETRDTRAFTAVNLGAIYKVTDHWSLMMSAGPGVQNARDRGQYDLYFALEATY
jgi:hypothetical protein